MTLDGKVVMLEKEKDPSILTAPYAGKLTRYLVDDGAHLRRGEPFAEVRRRAFHDDFAGLGAGVDRRATLQ